MNKKEKASETKPVPTGVGVEPLVIPSEVLHLVRFLAKLWHDEQDLRNEAYSLPDEQVKKFLIMEWPVVQGTRNLLNLSSIGKQPYDNAAVAKAVRWMLERV